MTLRSIFLRHFFEDMQHFERGNIDRWRFPAPLTRRCAEAAKETVFKFANRAGFTWRNGHEQSRQTLDFILSEFDKIEAVFALLADDHSRSVLLELLRYRVAGRRHVRLSHDAATLRAHKRAVIAQRTRRKTAQVAGWQLDLFGLDDEGRRL